MTLSISVFQAPHGEWRYMIYTTARGVVASGWRKTQVEAMQAANNVTRALKKAARKK